MQLGHDVTRFDILRLNSELIAICSFHLHRDAPEFSSWKALGRHHIVLPRTSMYLQQENRSVFVADPLMATLHNPGVAFRRGVVAEHDDESDYLIIDDSAVEEIAAEIEVPRGRRDEAYRFPAAQAGLSDGLYAQAVALFASAAKNACPPLRLEEQALRFVARVVERAHGMDRPTNRAIRMGAERSSRLDVVARAKRFIAERADQSPSLADIARGAHSSPFHLTRLFRQRTGLSLHQYVMAYKLRRSLWQLERYDGRLAHLAAAMGFSDLPHFSRQFQRAFGLSPRAFLRRGAVLAEERG